LKTIKSKQETIDKLNTGKFTFKGLFKNQNEKANEVNTLTQQIASIEKDISNYELIREHLIIYLSLIAIPAYKEKKFKTYLSAMRNFCTEEVDNAKSKLGCWSDFLGVIDKIE
jgi:regulator of sigma D